MVERTKMPAHQQFGPGTDVAATKRAEGAKRSSVEAAERAKQASQSLQSMERWFYTLSVALSGGALLIALVLFLCHAFGWGDLRSHDGAAYYRFMETVLAGWGFTFALYPVACEFMGRGFKHLAQQATEAEGRQ